MKDPVADVDVLLMIHWSPVGEKKTILFFCVRVKMKTITKNCLKMILAAPVPSINISLASQMIVATELLTLQFLGVRLSPCVCPGVRFPV